MTISVSCTCHAGRAGWLTGPAMGRRGVLAGLAAGAVFGAGSSGALASDGRTFDSMVLSCIDPRLVEPVHSFVTGAKR